MIEETKLKEEGQIKLGDDYVIYEQVRKNEKGGGGLALGALKELNPCWVNEGKENVESISINIFLNNMKIRCCVAYGPQENDTIENKDASWDHLDREVTEAEISGSGFVLQFDGNLWAGSKIIPGDPRPQNKNGKLLEQFLNRNPRLSVVNSLPECQGLITRSRMKDGILEESVLDLFIVCSSILPFVTRMVIDENKNHILTNFKAAKKVGKAIESDHYTEYMDLNIEINKERPERQEMFNFKDKNSQKLFKTNTSETNQFTECLKEEGPIMEKIKKWKNILISHCSAAFKKIRIKDRTLKPVSANLSELIDERNKLSRSGCICDKAYNEKRSFNLHKAKHVNKNYECEECEKTFCSGRDYKSHLRVHKGIKEIKCETCARRIESINIAIANDEALENRNKVMKQFKIFSDNPENIDRTKMWKLLKNICPKKKSILPSAKKNHAGKIISSKNDIK